MAKRQSSKRIGRSARGAIRSIALSAVAAAVVGFSAPMLIGAGGADAQGLDRTGQDAPGQGMMGPGMHGQGMMGQGMMGQQGMMGSNGGSAARHRQYMTSGVPEPYKSMRDPLPDSPDVIARGRRVFEENCASCHGVQGLGNGAAGRQLSPPPANLALLASMPMMTGDSYLYWAIAQGGTPFGTAMPAYEDALSKDQIWSVVRFLQAGLPRADGASAR